MPSTDGQVQKVEGDSPSAEDAAAMIAQMTADLDAKEAQPDAGEPVALSDLDAAAADDQVQQSVLNLTSLQLNLQKANL